MFPDRQQMSPFELEEQEMESVPSIIAFSLRSLRLPRHLPMASPCRLLTAGQTAN